MQSVQRNQGAKDTGDCNKEIKKGSTSNSKNKGKKNYKVTAILLIFTIILSVISLFIGVMDMSFTGLLSGDYEQLQLLVISRLPRLLAILCTGAGMSIAGLIMQNLCRNKFMSPTTGATISSAQFGILMSLMFLTNSNLMQKTLFAFGFSILGTWIFVFFIQKIKFKDIVMVPLVGIMFSNIIGGVTSYFAYKYNVMQTLNSWLVGDFSLVIKGKYEIVFLVVPLIVVAFVFANHFNIVGMGETFSKNLGINYNVVLFLGLSISALITSSIVVTVGTISYIGLLVPNIVSIMKGDKIKSNMLDVALFGASFVLGCDIIGRIVIAPYELPIDLIAGIIGSVLFIYLMFRRLGNKVQKKQKVELASCPCGATECVGDEIE